jgi:predicted DNA-binding protein (UPF0251 family)
MQTCSRCKSKVSIGVEQQEAIRQFKTKYFYVIQKDMAGMLGVSQTTVSEIMHHKRVNGE